MQARAGYGMQISELTQEDAAEVFDQICRRELGLAGSEFLSKWDAGDYEGVDVDDVDGLPEVVAAIPLVR